MLIIFAYVLLALFIFIAQTLKQINANILTKSLKMHKMHQNL